MSEEQKDEQGQVLPEGVFLTPDGQYAKVVAFRDAIDSVPPKVMYMLRRTLRRHWTHDPS